MKKIYNIFILLLLAAILFYGCGSSETIIKDKKISISVPAVHDSIPAEYKNIPPLQMENLDSVINKLPDNSFIEGSPELNDGVNLQTGKTDEVKTDIKYYPKTKTFTIDIPEHKVDTTITDTSKITIKKETTLAEKFGYALYGIIGFIIGLTIVYIIFKFIKK